ncbi:MAG: penicillin-binding protein [Deferrisomatales bacterium]
MSRRAPRRSRPGAGGRGRIALVAVAVLSLFAVAGARAVYLQVIRAPALRQRAEDQRFRQLELLPDRGTIYDRNGRELAQSIPGISVFADPSCLLQAPDDLERLGRALHLEPARVRRALSRGRRFAWIKRSISPKEEEAVRRLGISGIGLAAEPHRYYPKKSLAGQVIGFVGVDGKGLGGIEYRYDRLLGGTPRRVRAERDARGCLMLPDAPDPSHVRGRSLVLTLDETIQHIVEEELARAVEGSAARGGVAVAVDPGTGEILALAQVPAFNPNALSGSRPEDRKVRAVVDVYEPGSTFKALFLGILLDRGIVRGDDLVFCENGQWSVHGRTIHDHVPHGWLSVADVLKVSSNIGVAKLSEKIAPKALYRGLRGFGVGAATGVELAGESGGILPPPGTWSKITPKTVAYGQGVSATALQVAAAVAAVANGGVRMKPHLVRAVLDEQGREVEQFAPEPAGRALSKRAAATLTRWMERVVHEEGGTGTLAAVPGYRVAGKTGTSWKPDPRGRGYLRHKVVASFAGFVPSRAPRLAMLVAVDEPTRGSRYGGTVAAPAFREMARRILAHLRVPPEGDAQGRADPVASRRPKRSREPARAGRMPDLKGLTMREALRKLEKAGAEVDLSLLGSGVAASQDPAPGAPLGDGTTCRVVFRPLL